MTDIQEDREGAEAKAARRRRQWKEEARYHNTYYPESAIAIKKTMRRSGNQTRGEESGRNGHRLRGKLDVAERERLGGSERHQERHGRSRQKRDAEKYDRPRRDIRDNDRATAADQEEDRKSQNNSTPDHSGGD